MARERERERAGAGPDVERTLVSLRLDEVDEPRLERRQPPQRRLGDKVGVLGEACADGVVVAQESVTTRLVRRGSELMPVASS